MPGCFEDCLETAGTKLRSSIGVDDHDAVRFTSRQCRSQRRDGEFRGHAITHRVPDDPVGEQVLDRAAVDLAFSGRMFGQVRDPLTVRTSGSEVPAQQVIGDRRSGPFAFAAFLDGRGPQFLLGTQPPRTAFSNLDAGPLELIGQEPVTERRIITMSVDQRVDRVRVLQIPKRDRVLVPGVERLR